MNTATATPSVTSKIIGPQEASAMLVSYKYEHQRKPSAIWAQFLANEMKAGTFDQSTTIRIARVNGDGYLVDGQHRLMAVVESGIAQRFVIVENREGDFLKIADLYTRIDQNKRRTTDERFRTLDLASRWGMSPTEVNQLGAAVKLIRARWNPNAPSGLRVMSQDEHIALMDEYALSYTDFLDIVKSENSNKNIRTRGILVALRRSATVSVALITYRYSQEKYGSKVDDFWYGTVYDDGIAASDPRKFANRHMNETGMIAGKLGHSTGNVMTPKASSRIIASCFNDYIAGKYRKQMPKIMDYNAPMLILGSPFNGK